jgi:RNA recognition motif-containing protein
MNNLFKSPGAQIKGTSKIPNATCFVFYLPPIIGSNEALRALFMPYGTVLNAYVAMDKITGRTRGFGFVDFSRAEEASAAIEALDKYSIGGKFLHVSIKI